MSYQPLTLNNVWKYKQKDGSVYSNSVTAVNGNNVEMVNSLTGKPAKVKIDGDHMLTDGYEVGNFQVYLKNNVKVGDTWTVTFKANGLDCLLDITVKEVGVSKNVEGKDYSDVIMLEGESKMVMNGNTMALNFFTQWYYAKGTGLILTTSSAGDSHALVEYSLN
ncbi:MAG: hypothetical protein ACHQF2_03480 [Flavobacteriales bacterium]